MDSLINTVSEESLPILTEGGDTLFFARSFYKKNKGGKYAGSDIWMTYNVNGEWSTPTNNLGPLNTSRNNAVVGVGADGTKLYLIDTYGANTRGLAFSILRNGKWTKPQSIQIPNLPPEGFKDFHMDPEERWLFISMERSDTNGKEDLYISIKKGKNWSEPKHLGSTINTLGFESAPRYDEVTETLYFSSDGHSGFGNSDIYFSKRLYGSWDTWSYPQNLGANINSPSYESGFYYTKTNSCVLVSNRLSDNADIYILTRELIDSSKVQQAKNELLIEADRLLTEMRKLSGDASSKDIIFFSYNQIDLDSTEIAKINDLISQSSEPEFLKVSIELYSFEGNSTFITNQLIKKRAERIKNEIMDFGVLESQIVIFPFNRTNLEALESKESGGAIIEIRTNPKPIK